MDTSAISDSLGRALSGIFNSADPLHLIFRIARTLITAFIIILTFNLVQFFTGRFFKDKLNEQQSFMVRKGIKYTGMIMAILFVFRAMGIDTSALLGVAGVAGIVLGFAAQTSVSSLISGVFLLSEKPFTVGDAIKIDAISGVVLSVDLLSVKLRTFDNLFVRIPNETIIKSNLITITRFPIRRLDLSFSVAYKEDLEKVQTLLMDIASKNPYCLDEPAPFFGIDGFGDSGITVLFNVWFEKSRFWDLKNSIIIDIKKCFEGEQIEIPYQKMDITLKNDIGLIHERG
jgi:small-conductance mechanosensitive channel